MAATAADKVIANQYNDEYAHQVWWLVAPFLFLIGAIHYGSIALRKFFPGEKKPVDVEADGRVVRHASSFRWLPLTVANAYRVVAFRTALTIGPFSLNLAELALTIAYIAVLYVWSFVNSTYPGIPLTRELMIPHSHISRWYQIRARVLSEPRCEHCLWSAPTCRHPWYQEQHRRM